MLTLRGPVVIAIASVYGTARNNISENTYFGVGTSNIANQKWKKQVLTQNFILNRMPLLSTSESQYNVLRKT